MGFRFRRSFGVLPGLRINLGKRGASASIGVRGAHVTVGHTGVRTTIGIPGTGMSYTATQSLSTPRQNDESPSAPLAQQEVHASDRLGWYVAAALFIVLIAVLLSR